MAFHPNDNISGVNVNQRNQPLIGIVVNNRDPLQLRRVQVKIEGLLETTDEKSLPWFKPQPSGIGSRSDYGNFDEIPEINSTVQIILRNGDLRDGMYSAIPDTSVDASQLRLFGEDYPNTSGTCDSKGTWYRKNKTKGYEEHLHQSGFYTRVDKEGNLHIHVPGNVYVHIKGRTTIQVDKDLFLKVLKTLGLRGEQNAGISAGSNAEILAKNQITVQSESDSIIDLNTGTTFGVSNAVNSSMTEIENTVDSRVTEVTALQKVILESGELASESLQVHKDSLIGTRT